MTRTHVRPDYPSERTCHLGSRQRPWPIGGAGRREGRGRECLDGGPAHTLLTEGRAVARFGETEVLVVRTRRGIFAVENRCPHLGRRLTDATVSGRKVICMGHQRRYDLASGQPAGRIVARATRLRTFDVTLVDGRLWLSPRRAM